MSPDLPVMFSDSFLAEVCSATHAVGHTGLADIAGSRGGEGDQTTGGAALEGMWAFSVSFMTGLDSQDLGHGEKGVSISSSVCRDSCLTAQILPNPTSFTQGHTLGLAISDYSCRVFMTHMGGSI